MDPKLSNDLSFLVYQYLREDPSLQTAAHAYVTAQSLLPLHLLICTTRIDNTLRFERDTKVYFDKDYFFDLITNGKWDEVEQYFTSFVPVQNVTSKATQVRFEVGKQRLLEALER